MPDQIIETDVYRHQDFYVPAFQVLVNGKEVKHVEKDVVSLTYGDKKNGVDWAELTINNWNPDGRGAPACWKYSASDALSPWQEVEIRMGYYRGGKDELRSMLLGELVRLTPNFSADSPATLTARALGVLNRFRTAQISKDYREQKDSAIFQDIIGDISKQMLQVVPDIELTTDDEEIADALNGEKTIHFLTIKQQYAINYLLKRAVEHGYELTVNIPEGAPGGRRKVIVHFRSSEMAKRKRAVYNLEWGKTLLSFQPSLSTAHQVKDVIVRSWNPQSKKKFEARATLADLQTEGVIDPAEDLKLKTGPLSNRTEIVTDQVVQSDAEAMLLAKNRLRSIAQSIVVGRGRTIGLPDLRTGVMVNISGFGQYFDGGYVVEETKHKIDDAGYTTEFTARMETKKNGGQSTTKRR
jgi:uncharacterized protein